MRLALQIVLYWGLLPVALLLTGMRLDRILGWDAPILSHPLSRLAGGAMIVAGLLACLEAALWFAFRGEGLPSSAAPPKRLVTEGPFARCRHPIYAGYAVAALGMGLAAGSPATAAIAVPAFATFWFIGVHGIEESRLARRYGAQWKAYAAEVPFLVPRRRAGPRGWHPGWNYLLVRAAVRRILYRWLPVTVKGVESFPETGGVVLVANHLSYLDPFFLLAAIPRPVRFLATAEIFRRLLPALFFRAMGGIPYRRYVRDPTALSRFLRLGRAGEVIGLFPEGERSWDGRPGPMARGIRAALAAGVPVVPVRISGAHEFWPRAAPRPRRAPVHLEFGTPLDAPPAEALLAALGGSVDPAAPPAPPAPPEGPMVLSEGGLDVRLLRRLGVVRPEFRDGTLFLGETKVELASIRSVTVEGRDRLQIAAGGRLLQLAGPQARSWQLFLAAR